jgi:AcrR family transcriptional regulator
MVTAEGVRGSGRAGVAASPGPEARVLDAATTCIARWGVSKTTLDDVAREAGVSRATVYRLFPGGKSALLTACGAAEVSRLLLGLTAQIEAATSLERLLVDLIGGAARFIAGNDAIQMLLRHEPDVLLPFVAFDRQGPLLEGAVVFLAPHLERFVDHRTACETVEWVARLVISYTFTPAATIDLCDEVDVRRLVTNQLMPGIALASAP